MLMADTTDDIGGHDATHGGMPPPPGSKPPAAQAKDGDTDPGRGAPILPGSKPRTESTAKQAEPEAVAAPPSAPAESPTVIVGENEDLEATVIGEVASPFSLMRLKPAGHPLPITLTRISYAIGRSRSCDIPLFSQTAHRRHAQLSLREGSWILEPFENNIVIANGDLVRGEVQLTHKMRLQLGDDELIFFDEYKAGVKPRGEATRAAAHSISGRWRMMAVVAVAAAIAVAAWLLWRGGP
jgi:hypothetical protein